MPTAPTYNRQYNFTNYQAVNPATPLPATPLDTELSSVKVTLDALIANLNLIQRSDGQLANASVGPQQLQPSILTNMSPPTKWSGAGVSYQVGATVFSGLLFYVCNTANVSSAGNPPATFGAWTLLADFSGVSIPAGSITSAAFAPGAVNSAALGANLALPGSPSAGDNSTSIATTAFVDAQVASMLTGFRNRIINGAMAIDQRNGGAGGTAAGYTADRWQYVATQANKAGWQRAASTVPGFPFSLNIASSGTYTLQAGDVFSINTTIEANDIYDFLFGTAGAQPLTLSFWVNATTAGTYGGAIRNAAVTRSYPFSYTVSAASTWQKISIAIPGDTGGTWVSNSNAAGLIVGFGLGVGSSFVGVPNTWQTGNFVSVTGAGQIAGVPSAAFAVTGVSLTVGVGAATAPFEFRPMALELALCQRYYEAQAGDCISCDVTTSTNYLKSTPFATPKRAAPTMTYSVQAVGNFASGAGTSSVSTSMVQWVASSSGTGAGNIVINWTASADF